LIIDELAKEFNLTLEEASLFLKCEENRLGKYIFLPPHLRERGCALYQKIEAHRVRLRKLNKET